MPDEGLVQGYLARDYSLASGDYKVLMAKALQPGVTIEQVYGDSFYVSSVQFF